MLIQAQVTELAQGINDMFSVLRTSNKTLISPTEVIFASPTNDNVDARFINSSIQIAEERFIKPIICKDLYNDFKNKKNVVVTDINKDFLEAQFLAQDTSSPVTLAIGEIVNAIDLISDEWYISLWNEYLWKITAEAVTYIASPVNFSRFTATGEEVSKPQNPIGNASAASVDLATVKWKADKMLQDRISPLRTSLEEWLSDNRQYFCLYNCKKLVPLCDNGKPGIAVNRKTGFVFGVYDTLDNSC